MTVLWIIVGIILIFGIVVFRGAPYVPSQKKYIFKAFTDLYHLGKNDVLVDVGSGDGVVLRLAAKFGAKAIGYELNPILVIISRLISFGNRNISVKLADFWLTPLPDNTTVVYVFAVTRDIKKMIKKMQNEANRINHQISVITYGSKFSDMKSLKKVGAYHLYIFHPVKLSNALYNNRSL